MTSAHFASFAAAQRARGALLGESELLWSRGMIQGPEATATWKQTLVGFKDRQPLSRSQRRVYLFFLDRASLRISCRPGQTVDRIFLKKDPETGKQIQDVVTSRLHKWFAFEPGPFKGSVGVVKRDSTGLPVVVILHNFDGEQGRVLAEKLENTYGPELLGGRGPDNMCSAALQERRITWDKGNHDSCTFFKDGFRKLWPQNGTCHGGNYHDDVDTAPWCRSLLDTALDIVNKALPGHPHAFYAAARTTYEVGSVKIIRYRSPGCKLSPTKRGETSDCLHPHVDQDARASTVLLLSLGDTANLFFDDDDRCARVAACTKTLQMEVERQADRRRGDKRGADKDKHAWRGTQCDTCTNVTMRSGDVLLFNGHPSAKLAHGVIGTAKPSDGLNMPPWATGCRLTLQYRQLTVPPAGPSPPKSKRKA